MGYESRLYVVRKSDFKDDETGLYWCENIARINLSKVDACVIDGIAKYGKPTECYLVHGEVESNKDCYGDVMTELTVEDMITILKEAVNNSDYRRYPPALAMLESFRQGEMYGMWDDLAVLHYGY